MEDWKISKAGIPEVIERGEREAGDYYEFRLLPLEGLIIATTKMVGKKPCGPKPSTVSRLEREREERRGERKRVIALCREVGSGWNNIYPQIFDSKIEFPILFY